MIAQQAERRGQGLLSLMLAHFTNDIYSNFLPAFIPYLITKFSLSLTLAGAAPSVYISASSFTQLLFGYAGDRLRLARFVLIAPLITAVFMSAVGAMPSYFLVLCLLFLAALGTATFHPWAAPLAGGLSERKGTSLSLFIAAGSLGFALGPLLATGFISLAGFRQTYLLALPPLVGAALLARRARWPEEPLAAGKTSHPKPLRSIVPILPLWLIVILRTTVQMAFATFLLVLLEERELSHLAGSFVLGAFLIMGTAGTLLGGYLSDRFGRRLITTLSLALAYPLYLGFLGTEGFPSFLLLAAAGAVASASNPVLVAQAQELAPGHAGMASALTMGFGWGIAGLLMGLVGWMGDLWGLTASLRWMTLALPLAAAVSLKTKEACSSTLS